MAPPAIAWAVFLHMVSVFEDEKKVLKKKLKKKCLVLVGFTPAEIWQSFRELMHIY